MNILLLGRDGQVGTALAPCLSALGRVTALGRADAGGDLTDIDGLRAVVRALSPGVIVNAAAYTRVDLAEREGALAMAVNAVAPAVLAEEAARLGAWLVHYSTDYVFDGSGERPWQEADVPAPLNAYGRSKLAGERAVHQGCARHLLFRTSWVCSPRAGGFADAVLRQTLDGKPLAVVSDQVGAPTTAALVAEVTCGVLRQVLDRADDGLAGCYHLAAAGEVSRLGYARHVLARAQAAGLPLRTGPEQVAAVASADFPSPARRPLNSRLDTSLLRARFGLILPPWQDGVDQVVDALTASWRSASR